jgi:hypothetical protein
MPSPIGIRGLHAGTGVAVRHQGECNERKHEECEYDDPELHAAQEIVLMLYIREENEASTQPLSQPLFHPKSE